MNLLCEGVMCVSDCKQRRLRVIALIALSRVFSIPMALTYLLHSGRKIERAFSLSWFEFERFSKQK